MNWAPPVSVRQPILDLSDLACIRRVGFCVAPSPAPIQDTVHFLFRELGARCYGPNCGRIFGRIETVEI